MMHPFNELETIENIDFNEVDNYDNVFLCVYVFQKLLSKMLTMKESFLILTSIYAKEYIILWS